MGNEFYLYWIDRKGGRHFHKSTCEMVNDPKFHYEPVLRAKPRRSEYAVIAEGNRVYTPCPGCILPKRGKE